MIKNIDQKRCPKCGEPNNCSVARSLDTNSSSNANISNETEKKTCWCFSHSEIKSSTNKKLSINQACLCKNCLS